MKALRYRCPICHAKEGARHGDNCDDAGTLVQVPSAATATPPGPAPLALEPVEPTGTRSSMGFVDRDDGAGGLVGSFEEIETKVYPKGDGDRVRELRVALNLSLRDAALALGLEPIEMANLERGSARCDFTELERRLRAAAGTR